MQSACNDRAAALLAAAIRAAVLARAPRRTVSAVGAAVAGALGHLAPVAETRRPSEAGATAGSRPPDRDGGNSPSAEELLAALRQRRREARHSKKARRRAARAAFASAPSQAQAPPQAHVHSDGAGELPRDGHGADLPRTAPRAPPPQEDSQPADVGAAHGAVDIFGQAAGPSSSGFLPADAMVCKNAMQLSPSAAALVMVPATDSNNGCLALSSQKTPVRRSKDNDSGSGSALPKKVARLRGDATPIDFVPSTSTTKGGQCVADAGEQAPERHLDGVGSDPRPGDIRKDTKFNGKPVWDVFDGDCWKTFLNYRKALEFTRKFGR